ncbi:hypothetical protein BD311DRAFT_204677 [Dichomitus squalens]|uniref:protein-histidine N-methyltransferase n=2 Tax=Dichomitus squalens TaxID=114155 RepID=A0A4Q9N535_9APHY|nr:hypothetical protein BD311DRAFT_204677 [Dichomitus squalens]
MFKFNFDIDDSDDQSIICAAEESFTEEPQQTQETVSEDVSKEVYLEHLLSALPHTISFSPLHLSLPSQREVVLSRRDLFDARFQLISADDGGGNDNESSEVDFIDAPSDLVPGVYEGGLKTWECSLDLVECLDSIYGRAISSTIHGKRILELGCGTAIPSLYLFHSLFCAEPRADAGVHVHLQDYNELVLRLVTIPNVILAWYMSPASSAYRTRALAQGSDQTGEADDEDFDSASLPPDDPSQPGELAITPALRSAFRESLKTHGIHLRLFSGAWSTFGVEQAGGPYDILLTSETIYRTASLNSLVDLMQKATKAQEESASLEDVTSRLSLSKPDSLQALASTQYLCLVAAKLVYFGVGGGVNEFIQAVESASRGSVQTIWETSQGVKRCVMRVLWKS